MNNQLLLIFKMSMTLLHTILFSSLLIFILISNNVHFLTALLVIMLGVKFVYYLFDRCILTFLEEDSPYPTATEMFGAMITKKDLNKGVIEEIAINTGILLLFAKIFITMTINYNYKDIPKYFKNFISTFLYNAYKL